MDKICWTRLDFAGLTLAKALLVKMGRKHHGVYVSWQLVNLGIQKAKWAKRGIY